MSSPFAQDAVSESTIDNKADSKTKLLEGAKMLKVVEAFEQAYATQKANYNKLDGVTMNNMITVKSLIACLKFNKKNLEPEDPNWDTLGFEDQLAKLDQEVDATNAAYAECKKKEMALSEKIINKDTSTMKLASVEKVKKQQDAFYSKIDDIDDGIYAQEKESNKIWDDYENYNEALFKKKYDESTDLVKQTTDLIDEIAKENGLLTQEIEATQIQMKVVEPFNDKQKEFYKKISAQVHKVNMTLKGADVVMEKNKKQKKILLKDHNECGEIVEIISKMNEANDLAHLSKETEKLYLLCDNHKDYATMFQKLHHLLEEEIKPAREDLVHYNSDLVTFIADVKAEMKKAFDQYMILIRKLANTNGVNIEVQYERLKDFEHRNIEDPDNVQNIPHADVLYLKKEVSRYDISVAMIVAVKNSVIEMCDKMEKDQKQNEEDGNDLITPDIISNLQGAMANLSTQAKLEIPKTEKNIDQLEAYLVKNLKLKLNEDNKQSQAQIAAMKARFEGYQKYIDTLNEKVTSVRKDIADLQENYNDEDLEKENEFIMVLLNESDYCDNEINGDKAHRDKEPAKEENDGGYSESKANLVARKKIIISNTNKLVNTFNENNKLIKESNIQPKTDVQIHDIISKNRALQVFCASIDLKVTGGNEKGNELETQLDKIPNHEIPRLTEKYDLKNNTIDDCDKIFDKNEAKVNELEELLKTKTAQVDGVIQSILAVSPLNNPALPNKEEDLFVKSIADLLGKAHTLRDEFENVHKRLINQQDKLMDDIQPLNELGEREVKQEEVVEIMEKMKVLGEAFADLENNLKPLVHQLEVLSKDVDGVIDAEKAKHNLSAVAGIDALSGKLAQCEALKTRATDKLKEYNDGIEDLRQKEAADCPILLDTLSLLSEEAKAIEESIQDLEAQMAALTEKKNEHRVVADDAGANPATFTPKQLDELNGKLDDTHALTDTLLVKDQDINDDLDRRIEELKHLQDNNGAFDNLKVQGKELGKGLFQQLKTIREILVSVPEQIDNMLKSLEEQKYDTEPDKKTADYFENKRAINEQIKTMTSQKKEAEKVFMQYPILEKTHEDCKAKLDQAQTIEQLKAVNEEYAKLSTTMTEVHATSVEIKDTVITLRKEMGDCIIPVNITKRAAELVTLHDLFNKIEGEFQAYKAEHRTNLKENEYEKEIREIIDTLYHKLDEQDNARRELNKFQKATLEKYTEEKFMENDNSKIILEVREHKMKIRECMEDIAELEKHFYYVMESKDKFHALNDIKIDCDAGLDSIAKIIDSDPQRIINLLCTLDEMKKSSEPGPHDDHCKHTPDYFDSADKIAAQTKLLKENQQKLQKVDDDFASHEDKVDEFISKSRQVDDNSGLDGIIGDFQKELGVIQKISKTSDQINADVTNLEKELHDCGIPLSIGKRIDDLAQFDQGLTNVIQQFADLQGLNESEFGDMDDDDDEFINPDTEAVIRQLVVQIDKEIYGFQVEQKEFIAYQTDHIEATDPEHHKDHSKAADLIKQVREHKHDMQDAIRRLHDLDLLVKDAILRKETYAEINDQSDTCEANFCALLDMNSTLPKEIKDSLATLEEMLNSSIPDTYADYFEQRQEIEEWIYSFKQTNESISKIKNKYVKQKVEFETLSELSKKETDIHGLLNIKDSFDKQVVIIDAIVQEVDGYNEDVMGIKENMGYCSIPDNITKRANEIEDFKQKLKNIQIDFYDFKIDYAKSSNLSVQSKVEIKKLLDQIDQKLFNFDEERKNFSAYQKQTLEIYTSRDYMNNNKAPGIIIEIREFQAKIIDANERLKAVLIFIEDAKQKKGHHQLINNVCKDMEVDIGNLKDFVKSAPTDIKHLLETLSEMKMGSMPDKNADYFEQKDQIDKHINELKNVDTQISGIQVDFNAKHRAYQDLKDNFKKQASNDELSAVQKKHENQKKDFIIILAKANKCRETIDYIRTNMDECEIPYTINLRAEEVDKFTDKLERITYEFQELKANDYEECSSETKAGIRRLIDEMVHKLTGFEDDKEDFNKFQKGTLDQYTQKDFVDIKNAPIIKEIREHKLKIYDSNWRLGELEDFLRTAKAQKVSLLQIDSSHKQLTSNLGDLYQYVHSVPKELQLLRDTLEQMQLATIPLKGFPKDKADYADQAQQIQTYLNDLDNYEAQLANIDDDHKTKTEDHKELKERSGKETEVTSLVNITQEFGKHHQIVQKLFSNAQDLNAKVQGIKTTLDDCTIPINIAFRAKEIRHFQEKLITVNDSFTFLQKILHVDTDQKVVQDINQKLQGFREEQKSFVQIQKVDLDTLTKDDFLDQPKQVQIIPQIKEHKDKITDATARLKELGELINKTIAQQHSHGSITESINDIASNIAKIRALFQTLPDQIEKMLLTNNEMKNGSEPDDTADYWEERTAIASNITNLISAKNKLHDIEESINKKEVDVKNLVAKSKKTGDNDTLTKIENGISDERASVEDILNSMYDTNDDVMAIKQNMGECEIAVNIAMRENEIEHFITKLERIEEDFKDLKQADEDFEGSSSSEADIKKLINAFGPKLAEFQADKRDFNKTQQNKLNRYRQTDFVSYDNAPIIVEIREFKQKIAEAVERLKGLDALTNELNNLLILQDIENASRLLEVKNNKLRERLEIAQTDLKKIDNCGTEMDGNCSRNEEEEFIEALKDEMPDVFNNITGNFEQIDKIQSILVQIKQSKSIDMLQTLKSEVDDATQKVEQCEGLVNKLENEIIEWDAQKKLCRRDEELEEIDNLLKDFQNDLHGETDQMYPKLEQNTRKLESSTSAQDVEDFQKLVEGIKEYIADVEKLGLEVNFLLEEKEECFDEFDGDIPTNIKNEREIRRKAKNLALSPRTSGGRSELKSTRSGGAGEKAKPNEKFYMIHVNCKYRKRIHEMLKNLRELNKKRRQLEDKWGPFKRELNKVKEVKVYKAIKGDAIDELFAFHLNKHQLNLPIKRIGPGKYLFGTKQILAKIINGKLVIRVGGGYMSADEFIEQYGPMEILKMQQSEDKMNETEADKNDVSRATMSKRASSGTNRMSMRQGSGSPRAGKGTDMAQMKAQMRESMNQNVKIYDNDNPGQGSPKAQGSPKRKSVAGGSPPRSSMRSSPKARN